MDKFDEYLKNKSKNEKDRFIVPKSFNNKIENVLNELDIDDRKNKKNSKRFLAAAASILIIFILGKSAVDLNSIENTSKSNTDVSKGRSIQDISQNKSITENSQIEADFFTNKADDILNSEIYKIIYDKKEITDVNKINQIINYINNMDIELCNSQDITDWAVEIKLEGEKDFTINIHDGYMKINNETYICNIDQISKLISIVEE